MEVRNVEGVANHNGPESCGGIGNGVGEALTGEHAGRVLSREMETHIERRRRGERRKATFDGPLSQGPAELARSETPCMRGSIATGNREVPRAPAAMSAAGRIGKSTDTRR